MKILLKKLRENALMPMRGSACAAGYDLYACLEEPVVIRSGETVKVGTGISAAIPEGWFGAVFARSGLALPTVLAYVTATTEGNTSWHCTMTREWTAPSPTGRGLPNL